MKKISPILLLIFVCVNVFSQSENANNYLDFDGEDDYVDIQTPILPSQFAFTPFTLEFKFLADSDEHMTIFSQYFKEDNNRTEVKINYPIGKLSFWKFSSGIMLESQSTITDGKWHHVAIVKDATGNLELYIDGVLENEGFDSNAYPNYDSTIGRIWNNNDNRFFKGKIDDLKFWSYARTESEIVENIDTYYEAGEEDLDLYYNFNQGIAAGDNFSIDYVIDGSGNNIEGSMENFSLNGTSSNWLGTIFSAISETILNESEVELFPNPTAGGFYLRLIEPNLNQVELYDLNSKVIKVESVWLDDENIFISTNNIKAGSYFVKLIFDSEKVLFKKLNIIGN